MTPSRSCAATEWHGACPSAGTFKIKLEGPATLWGALLHCATHEGVAEHWYWLCLCGVLDHWQLHRSSQLKARATNHIVEVADFKDVHVCRYSSPGK